MLHNIAPVRLVGFAAPDPQDLGLVAPVNFGECASAPRVNFDRLDFLAGETSSSMLCSRAPAGTPSATLPNAPHIFGSGYNLEMRRVAARWIATCVVDFHSGRNLSDCAFIGNTVRSVLNPALIYFFLNKSVSLSFVTSERPAFVTTSDVNFWPEPVGNGLHVVNSLMEARCYGVTHHSPTVK
jgi:hypothetical protein